MTTTAKMKEQVKELMVYTVRLLLTKGENNDVVDAIREAHSIATTVWPAEARLVHSLLDTMEKHGRDFDPREPECILRANNFVRISVRKGADIDDARLPDEVLSLLVGIDMLYRAEKLSKKSH